MNTSERHTSANQAKMWREASFEGTEMLRAAYRTHCFPPHEHAEYAIGFIERGSQAYTLDRRVRMLMPAGSICLINPGQLHEGRPAMDGGWHYRMMYVSIDSLQMALRDSLDSFTTRPVHFPEAVVNDKELLEQLYAAHVCSESADASALEKSTRLITALKRLAQRHSNPRSRQAPSTILPGAVKRAREYIDACFASNPSLGEIAQVAGLSPFHLLRAFKQFIGVAPHAYLIQRRVESARHLLLKGNSLRAIAISVGYCDQAHLSREFRRFYGVPPSKVICG